MIINQAKNFAPHLGRFLYKRKTPLQLQKPLSAYCFAHGSGIAASGLPWFFYL